MSKLAVFVRPTWNKGALPIGVAQYHLTRALLLEPQRSLINSCVRLEVKKPRWGSSNKFWSYPPKMDGLKWKNLSNWWFKCPPIWGNLRIRRDYSRESLAYPGGFGGKQTSMISAISIPLVLDACFAKNLGSLNEYSWPLVNGYQPPLYSPHQVLNSFQFLDPCSIPT